MSREKAQQFLTEAMGVDIPYCSFGKINSLDLWGFSELMILQLYQENKDRWKNTLDIGANIGLHSIVMSKLGWHVKAFEPQPDIYDILMRNRLLNKCDFLGYKKAVHTSEGSVDFVRVLNNLTGSHIDGFKNSYGPRETIRVQTVDCKTLWLGTDFAKIDCEGNEAELCLTMTEEDMSHMDCILEVRNTENAARICTHFMNLGVSMWSQKNDWKRVQSFSEMPMSNRDGSLFVGHNKPF